MDARLQRRVQRYGWDRAAGDYEAFWSRQLEPAQDRLLELAALQPAESVLDVACGTGLVTLRAAEMVGRSGRVMATDLSGRMVERLVDGARARELRQIEGRRMGAEALDLPDSTFDVTLCALGLMYVPNPVDAMREMCRVTRPGGRIVASVWGSREACGWAEVFPIVDARVASEVCPMFFNLGNGDGLALTFEMAGLRDVRTERLSTRLEYKSVQEALGAAFIGGPVAMAYSRFDEAVREAVHAEYLESIEAYREGDGFRIPGEFVLVRGERLDGD